MELSRKRMELGVRKRRWIHSRASMSIFIGCFHGNPSPDCGLMMMHHLSHCCFCRCCSQVDNADVAAAPDD
eukprot:scaffold5632_cov146-Skeletonema_marinoi.AAC.11